MFSASLIECIKKDDASAAESLLHYDKLGGRHLWQATKYKENDLEHPLIAAIELCNSEKITAVIPVLLKYGLMINEAFNHEYEYRPIIAAIKTGNVQLINDLIDHGAEVKWPFYKDYAWPCALTSAVAYMKHMPTSSVLPVIETLVKRGCEINPTDEPPPLQEAMSFPADDNLRVRVMEKLIELGADVNLIGLVSSTGPHPQYQQSGTPLHAYYNSGIKAVSVLLDNGADASLKNSYGLDVIDFFKMYVDFSPSETQVIDILKMLERRFPNLYKNKTIADKNGSRGVAQTLNRSGESTFSAPRTHPLLKITAGVFGSIVGAYVSAGVGLLGVAIIMLIVGFFLIPIAFFFPSIYSYLEAALMAICGAFIVIGAIIGFLTSANAVNSRNGVLTTMGIAFGAIVMVAVSVLFNFAGFVFEPLKAMFTIF